jgi:hypothetical protein
MNFLQNVKEKFSNIIDYVKLTTKQNNDVLTVVFVFLCGFVLGKCL